MATTPTQDAVPSESPRNLKYNAGKIDEFVTSFTQQYIDRFGQAHYTIEGLRQIAKEAIAAFGYITMDSFQDGATLTLPNQVLRDEVTGEYYRWDGALPKEVPIGSTPETSGGVGLDKWVGVGDAALRSILASKDGASLSLSQVSTAYGLDFSLGGVWTEGAVSTVDNWWWYNNKVYTGGSGALPATPSAPWYPIRPGYKLNLTDFITSKGSTNILDTVAWQWAFDSAYINLKSGYTGVVNMDAREYPLSSDGLIMKQGVSIEGSSDAMFGPDLNGKTVIYISHTPTTTSKTITCYGNNSLINFGVFYKNQVYSSLKLMSDFGCLFYFDEDPALGGIADAPKGEVISGVSVCGGSKVLYFAGACEYNDIDGFSATPTPFGPVIYCEIATDITRIKRVHLNANVVSMYRQRYSVDITTRYLTRSDSALAIGIQLNRWDGGNIIDMLQYGIPLGVVIGSISGGTAACSVSLTNCTFDYTSIPIYINCPQGAFGVMAVNSQFAFGPQYPSDGSIQNAVVYFGSNSTGHSVMLSNVHCQYGAGGEFRLFRAVSGSRNNKILITNSRLSSYSPPLNEGTSNTISIIGSIRNDNGINRMENITENSVLVSSMGELNTIVRQAVVVNLSAASTADLIVTYPYTGWVSSPVVKTEVTNTSGIAGTILVTARTVNRTATGCTVRVTLSASATGSVNVDLYLMGAVRGVLTAV